MGEGASAPLASKTGIAILGCGFVADYYMATLPNHPALEVRGAYDTNGERRSRFCSHYQVRPYASCDALLADQGVELVLNLTPPQHHFATSQAALNAGKHVYSEKPLAMDVADAEALVALAAAKGLSLSGAPSSLLGESAQAAWAALRRGEIGAPRLAYAEMEDGMVFRDSWQEWHSASGAPWPAVHEFEIGCTLEHAGYYLTWLCAFFGPVTRLTAFASTRFPDKASQAAADAAGHGASAAPVANDLSIACLEHESGVVSRLSCGLVAPRDRSMAITGTDGSLHIADGWDTRGEVRLRRERWHKDHGLADRLAGGLERRLNRLVPGLLRLGRRLPLHGKDYPRPAYPSRMDFMRGPAEQARALREGRVCRLSPAFVLHVTELALVLQHADTVAQPYLPRTRFAPIPPMEWAGSV
jgi:predicted dehydrogenase